MLRRSYELCFQFNDDDASTSQVIEGLYRQPDLFTNYLRIFLQSHVIDDGGAGRSQCANRCSRIIADATGLLMQRKYADTFEAPWRQATSVNEYFTGSTSNDRNFFNSDHRRIKTLIYALSHKEGLSQSEWIDLMNRLESAEIPAFNELSNLILDSHSLHDTRFKVAERVGDFLSSISSPVSPVVTLVPFCVRNLVIRLHEGNALMPSEQKELYKATPVLFRFYRYLTDRQLVLQVCFQFQLALSASIGRSWRKIRNVYQLICITELSSYS